MNILRFDGYGAMEREALALLREAMGAEGDEPRAIMLTGGQTPLEIYGHIARRPFSVDPLASVLISDERYVSVESPESNYGNIRNALEALGMTEEAVLRVHTELPFEAAAERYHEDLARFLERGTIGLGLLGLGADGHIASLFTPEDVVNGAGRLAVAVTREDGSRRISVTPDLLARIERIVLLVAGREKSAVVEKMRSAPGSMVAGRVLADMDSVEIWYSRSR